MMDGAQFFPLAVQYVWYFRIRICMNNLPFTMSQSGNQQQCINVNYNETTAYFPICGGLTCLTTGDDD